MINKIKIKYEDYIVNVLSFGIYIGIQQLVLLPILANKLNTSSFSNSILFLTFFNIISIAMGNELGNVYILNKNNSDFIVDRVYFKLLRKNTMFLIVISIFLSILLKNNFILLFLTLFLSNIKNFFSGVLRKNNKYHTIMKSNVYYSIGIITGLITMLYLNNYLIPFLFGEFLSTLYVLFNMKKYNISISDNKDYVNIKKEFKNLFLVSLLLNGLSYLDRFLIFPILGAEAMSSYYSTSSMSKFLSLLVTPVNNVMMAKLSNSKKGFNERRFKKIIFIAILVSISLSIITSFLGLYILYRPYFYVSLNLIIPVGIGSGLTITILLIKSLFMLNNGTQDLIKINSWYACIFILAALIGSNMFGLIGFAWSNVFSRIIQLYMYWYMFKKGRS